MRGSASGQAATGEATIVAIDQARAARAAQRALGREVDAVRGGGAAGSAGPFSDLERCRRAHPSARQPLRAV